MLEQRNVLLAGSTGLIGAYVLKFVTEDGLFENVVALSRKPMRVSGMKVKNIVTDFKNLDNDLTGCNVNTVFCCLGTTIKTAGSQEAFMEVDYEYVIRLAVWAKANGVTQFYVVSALGADSNSKIFYNRVKGKMEDALRKIGFNSLVIFRPSILTGKRKEFRLGERIGIAIAKFVSPLLIGALKKYRPIEAKKVAKAMVKIVFEPTKEWSVIESDKIAAIAG